MKLRGIEFGNVLGASGGQGFFGEGYRYHKYLRPFGLDFRGMTPVAKTTTLPPRAGNMPLRKDFTPQEFIPKCIYVDLWKGVALNSVGLSNPGAEALLDTLRWDEIEQPFFLSFMSVALEPEDRLAELRGFVDLFTEGLPDFCSDVGLQINYSCPNAGLHLDKLPGEVKEGLRIASRLGIPLMPKFNVELPIEQAIEIGKDPNCDALCISNTVPYGHLPNEIDWKGLFGDVSPLAHLGGGGLSGKPLLPLVIKYLHRLRREGFTKPINGGGGILSLSDARRVLNAGADSIFLGSIAFLRPWRVRGIIQAINRDYVDGIR